MGLGRSGLAAARLLRYLDAEVTITERKDRRSLSPLLGSVPEGVRIEAGGHPATLLDRTDIVVVSPGVPVEQPLLRSARERGIEVIGEMELAYRVAEPYRVPWIAVTGTNGKSTTVTLTGLMLRRAGYNAVVAGNIGTPITEEVLNHSTAGTIGELDYVVVEVSSFQLESIQRFRPSQASILNISPDHLDRHGDMGSYVEAKAGIFRNQGPEDRLILNLDDPYSGDLGARAPSELFYFSRAERIRGAYLDGGWLCLDTDGSERRVVRADEVRIRGLHNLENALAASLNAYLCGVDPAVIRAVLMEFDGLEHRMELVDELQGVSFYNDSKGTNVGSVLRSIEGFGGGIILILGGMDKGGDFSLLRDPLRRRAKGLVVMGEAKEKILGELGTIAATETADDMTEAVGKAYSLAEAGDVVLLSPGCASFDMFEDFEHRGRAFKEAVEELRRTLRMRGR